MLKHSNNTIPDRLYLQDFAQNVHKYYSMMRRDQPVFRARLSRMKRAYLITKYHDIKNIIQDERIVKDPNNARDRGGRRRDPWLPKSFRPLMKNMLNQDEPGHRRLRNLVQKAFTNKAVAEMEPEIERIANELADNMYSQLKQGPVDFVNQFALPLPVQVIAEMIGFPKSDFHRITSVTDRLLKATSFINALFAIPTINSFIKYVRKLADERRSEPRSDLLSALVQAEIEGDRLTDDEIIGMVFLLVVAGHETTVGLISNALLALFEFPEQRQRLASEPNLMDSAVEEFLRYDGPLSTTELAFAKSDLTLHGVTIPQGSIVLPAILSANRDEEVFENPNELVLDRNPNRHLAFGHGIHYCLGAPLARLETSIAMRTVLDRPELQLAVEKDRIQYKGMFITHRPNQVPLRLADS